MRNARTPTLPDLVPTATMRVVVAQDQTPVEGQPATALVYLRTAIENPCALAGQTLSCRAAAQRLGARILATYSDIGSGVTRERPGLGRLLRHLQTCAGVDYVIVHKLDRLSRSAFGFVVIADAIAERGVSLVIAG